MIEVRQLSFHGYRRSFWSRCGNLVLLSMLHAALKT